MKQGESFLQKPLYDSAYKNYLLALQEYRIRNNPEGIIECLNRLATIDNIFTRTTQAIHSLRESANLLAAKPGMKKQLAICEEQLGRSYEDLGDIEESGKHVRRALRLRLELYGESDARTAYAYMNLARYHSFRKVNDSSFYYSQKAYTICKEYPEHIQEIRYPELLLQHAYDSKNKEDIPDEKRESYYKTIRSLYHNALAATKRTYTLPSAEEAAAYQGLANTYNDQVRLMFGINRELGEDCFNQAKTYYDRSLAIKRRLYGEYHRSVSVSYYTKGLIYGVHPDLNTRLQAFPVYQEAIRSVVPGYIPTGPFDLPEGLKSSHPYQLSIVLKECYYLLLEIYKKTGEHAYLKHAHDFASFRLSVWDEIVRRFESSESGSTIWIWGNTPFEDAVITAYDMYIATGDSLYLEEMFSFSERGRNNDFAEQRLRTVRTDGRLKTDRQGRSAYSTSINRNQFTEHVLDSLTAYVCFIPHNEAFMPRDFAMVMSKDRFEVRELNPKVVDSLVKVLESSLQTKRVSNFAASAHSLYKELLMPLLQHLPNRINRLILSVDGIYTEIPFESLLTASPDIAESDFRHLPYLLKRYTVQYALSASHLYRVSSDTGVKTARISVFVPSFPTKSTLLFSNRSATTLSESYKGDFHIGPSATLNTFRSSAIHAGILQLSTHAMADLASPGKSVLLFTGGAHEDSLYLEEVLRFKLSNPLTIISACETGKGKAVYAEGSKSFARAFAYAGSRSVLSTLWQVDDKASSELITGFYRYMSTGMRKPEALRRAKLDYIASCRTSLTASPFYWSGMIISGNPNPILPETSFTILTTTTISIVVGLVILAFLIHRWRRSRMKRRLSH